MMKQEPETRIWFITKINEHNQNPNPNKQIFIFLVFIPLLPPHNNESCVCVLQRKSMLWRKRMRSRLPMKSRCVFQPHYVVNTSAHYIFEACMREINQNEQFLTFPVERNVSSEIAFQKHCVKNPNMHQLYSLLVFYCIFVKLFCVINSVQTLCVFRKQWRSRSTPTVKLIRSRSAAWEMSWTTRRNSSLTCRSKTSSVSLH